MSSTTVPLSRALRDDRPGDAIVAFDRGVSRRRRELAPAVETLAAALGEAGAGRWLLCADDAWSAAVALLACAHTGCIAVLPPNRQPDTLRRLAAEARGALAETALPLPGLPSLAPRMGAPGPHSPRDWT